jgi:hypothetical protein
VQPDKPNQTTLSFFLIHRAVTCSHPTYIYGVAGEAGLAYGLGLRATRAPRDLCRGIPGHSSLRPRSMWSHPWTLSRATRTDRPHRGLGAGPDRAEARRHLRLGVAGYPDAVSCMDAGYPVHVWGCRCIPGTMTCQRFKERMISKISEIDREHPWTTRQLFNSITLGHNSDPTLQIISWEGFCQA